MATKFIGGRTNYNKTIQATLTNAVLTDFPPSAKAFKVHPDTLIAAVEMFTDGQVCTMLIANSDAGTLFPFRPEQLKLTSGSATVDIEYLF